MKVADVQHYLKNLIELLGRAGGKGPAGDLEHLCAGMEPFRELTLAEFGDILRQTDEYRRTGTVTSGRSTKAKSKPTADAEKVREALVCIEGLYERAMSADALRHDAISAEVARLDKALNKEEGLELARSFLGTAGVFPSKIAALEAIGRKIADRLTAQKRVGSLDRNRPAPAAESPDGSEAERQSDP